MPTPGTSWSVEQLHPSSVVVKLDVPKGAPIEEWRFPILLSSDRHHDHAMCDQAMERKHLEQVVARDGAWLDAGDMHCAMQSKFDRRSDKSALRPEYTVGRYHNALVSEAAKFYGPYADRLIAMSPGNHETAAIKNHEIDLTLETAERLRNNWSSDVRVMTYEWFCTFRVQIPEHKKSAKLCMNVHHGFGGGGDVTRGEIQFQRKLASTRADVYWMGHIHEARVNERVVLETTNRGVPVQKTVHTVRTPSYKNEHKKMSGFLTEKGVAPKPLGAFWMWLTLDYRGPGASLRIVPRFERAD